MENNTQMSSLESGKKSGVWQKIKSLWVDALAVLLFLLLTFAYFQTPIAEGLVLGGHDNDASVGLAHDLAEYSDSGEIVRWTNSVFGGMPTYQIGPRYESTDFLSWVESLYSLGTSGVFKYVFLYLIGFYILMRAFKCKPWISVLGAVVWAFSSYFFIIIAAGHIWKVITLGFVPPTIAGLILCYRGKYVLGGAVTALFTALQISANHIQMSYYFFFVMAAIVIAYGVYAFKKGEHGADYVSSHFDIRRWCKATGVIAVAGLLGVMANISSIYHTYEYSQDSMRGKSELVPLASAETSGQEKAAPASGLSYDYITAWSYGLGETFTLMIPDFNGGGSGESMLETSAAQDDGRYLYQVQHLAQQLGNNVPGVSCYWGEQPGTVGPVYVGAIVCFLFVLGLFLVRGPIKWALLVATLISFTFAWGSHIPAVTHFLIDYLPMYNKFRTVSSALVIAEFTMPLLAMLCLAKIIRKPEMLAEKQYTLSFYVAFALTGGICLLLWIAPGMAGSCINSSEYDFFNYLGKYQSQLSINLQEYQHTVSEVRQSILAGSAGRSFLLIVLSAGTIICYARFKSFKGWMLCGVLLVASVADMWSENKRYLNDSCFTEPTHRTNMVQQTPADEYILKDTDPDFRVFDVKGFSSNRSSYYHKAVGGYHAAKLRRYQDLIERHISREGNMFVQQVTAAQKAFLQDTLAVLESGVRSAQALSDIVTKTATGDSAMSLPVLNMLNTKYFIFGNGDIAVRNYGANGNAWFVQQLDFVEDANAEMAGLNGLDTKKAAVADKKFRAELDGSELGNGSASLTQYAPNELHYDVHSDKGGVVVFSEVYYPGWTATIDGESADLGRVNYVLRALKVPAGDHKVVLEFRPNSITVTDTIGYVVIALIFLAFLFSMYKEWKKA